MKGKHIIDYEMFKERIVSEIRDCFPGRYRQIKVKEAENIKEICVHRVMQ